VTRCPFRPNLHVLVLKLQETGRHRHDAATIRIRRASAVVTQSEHGGTDIVTARIRFPADLQPADADLPLHDAGQRRVEESIFNARFSVRQRTLAHGRRRARGDGTTTPPSSKAAPRSQAPPVEAPDIRAGAAARAGWPSSERRGPRSSGLEYIDRGYERLEEALSALGAQVQRSSGVIPETAPTGTFENERIPGV